MVLGGPRQMLEYRRFNVEVFPLRSRDAFGVVKKRVDGAGKQAIYGLQNAFGARKRD